MARSARPVRLAILSDLHIDREVEKSSWPLAKKAFRAAVEENVDHVVVAGDLFDCATAMLRDRDDVEGYLRKLGLWHRDRLTVVVGNHDIFHTSHHGGRIQHPTLTSETVPTRWIDPEVALRPVPRRHGPKFHRHTTSPESLA